MSKVIALFENDKLEFYNLNLEKIEDVKDGDEIYLILPDNFVFLYQTEISARRKTSQIISAYAKTLFYDYGHLGYVKLFNPFVGYSIDSEKLNKLDNEILSKVVFVSSLFLIYAYTESDFAYLGNDVCSLVSDGRLKFYAPGDESVLLERLSGETKIVKYDKVDLLSRVKEIIENGNIKKVAIDIGNNSGLNFENWKIYRFVAVIIICLAFIGGEAFKYASYSKDIKNAQQKLTMLYKKALGSNNYADPYGMLLYKADYSEQSSPFSLTKVIYYLSKAKGKYKVNIDYVSYSGEGLKIRGTIDSYKNLLGFVGKLNNLMKHKFVVQNTSSKNGKLSFSLVCNG